MYSAFKLICSVKLIFKLCDFTYQKVLDKFAFNILFYSFDHSLPITFSVLVIMYN